MSAGDLVNSLGKLESKLKQVKFPNYRRADFLSGTLDIYLAVYGYVFSSFNCEFSKAIAEKGLELYGKTNKHFVDNLYRIVRDILCYKPPITKNMFLTNRAFIEMKMIMCTHILDLVLQKCKEFPSVIRRSAHRKTRIPVNRSDTNEGPRPRNINSGKEEPAISVRVSNASTSILHHLDNNTHFHSQQNVTRFHSHIAEHNLEAILSEKKGKNNNSIKPLLGKNLFHTCSSLGISRNYQITRFVLPPNSKSHVILEKQKSNIDKIPVSIEMGPFPEKEKTLERLITKNENSNYPSNCVGEQYEDISSTIPKVAKYPPTVARLHRNARKISNSSKEINNDPIMENISETLVKSAEILQDLQQKNLKEKLLDSSKLLLGKENSPVLSLATEIAPVDQQQPTKKENITKNQTLCHTSVELNITCKKELDYCIAKMNLMECAIKSLESKLEKL